MANENLLRITFDTSELQRLSEMLKPEMGKAIRSAYMASLKRALNAGKSEIGKVYQSVYPTVAQKVIRNGYVRTYVWPDEDIQKIGAVLEVKSKGVSLRHFAPKPTKTGVSWQAASGRKEIEGGFYVERMTTWFRRKEKTRLPIEKLWGPSPYAVFVREDNRQSIGKRMLGVLNAELPRQISFYTNKAVMSTLKGVANG